jgi:hypothetical protein
MKKWQWHRDYSPCARHGHASNGANREDNLEAGGGAVGPHRQ